MSKNTKKQDNLFISTQQDETQAQMMVPSDQLLNFQVEETLNVPYILQINQNGLMILIRPLIRLLQD